MSDGIIDRIERWGYAYEDKFRVCPVCGDECKTFYIQDGAVLGCEHCIDTVDADEWEY